MFIKLKTFDGTYVINTDKIVSMRTVVVAKTLYTKIELTTHPITTSLTMDEITEAICSGATYADLTDRA
jgi:hypothetical protein